MLRDSLTFGQERHLNARATRPRRSPLLFDLLGGDFWTLIRIPFPGRRCGQPCRALQERVPSPPHPPPARPMPISPEDLLAYLGSLSIEAETVEHPPLHTVEDSRALRGDIPGGHTKNLFVKDKKNRLFLLVLGETTAIDLKRVHEKIGAQGRVSFGSADL